MAKLKQDQWVPALQMSYRYNPETGLIVFSDGVTYTIDEAIIIAKGRTSDETIRAIHQVKKTFNGVLEEYRFERREDPLPEHDAAMPGTPALPAV